MVGNYLLLRQIYFTNTDYSKFLYSLLDGIKAEYYVYHIFVTEGCESLVLKQLTVDRGLQVRNWR